EEFNERQAAAMGHRFTRRKSTRSTGTVGSSPTRRTVAVGWLNRLPVVGPKKPLAECCRVAHQSRHGRIVLFAIFESADHGPVKTRALGHFADTDSPPQPIPLERLQYFLDVEVHPHRHDGVGVAISFADQVIERGFLPLKFLAERTLAGSLLGRFSIRAEFAARFHLFLRFFLGDGGGTS